MCVVKQVGQAAIVQEQALLLEFIEQASTDGGQYLHHGAKQRHYCTFTKTWKHLLKPKLSKS